MLLLIKSNFGAPELLLALALLVLARILHCVFVRPLVRAFKQGLHGEPDRAHTTPEMAPYQRMITPESDLLRACRQCGHVNKAFFVACPMCGIRLS